MVKVSFFIIFVLFAQNGFARISPFPNQFMPLVMVCTDISTDEIVAEIYERDDASAAWAGVMSDEGKPGLISIVRINDGFSTKKGSLSNFKLLQNESLNYQMSLHIANLDGSDGSVVIAANDVVCSSPQH